MARLPYENSTSGKRAIAEMQKILQAFGAQSFGCMEEFDRGEVIIQFRWRERHVVMKASAKGYAQAWLKRNPYSPRSRGRKEDYEKRALQIGQTAVYSILRDWIKGQITAVEIGMLSFEAAFLGNLLLSDGRTVMDRITEQKLLQIEGN